MIVTGPLFLIVAPLFIAPVVYLLRRVQPVAALIAGLLTLWLAWVSLALPLDRPEVVGRLVIDLGAPLRLFDRELLVEPNDRPALVFIYVVATVLFWFAWRADQGPVFFSLGLVLLSLFGGVLLMRPFQYAALLLAFAATIAAFLIQGGRPGRTQAALRYLVTAFIALPPILVAGWELEKFADTPDEVALLRIAAVLFACTFAVLLASVPFHGWVPAVGADAPPLVAALLYTAGQTVVLAWLLSLLEARPQLLRYLDVYQLMSWAGLGMVTIGALLAFSRASFGRLMGYAALVDMGALLMALGLGSALGLQAALMTLVLRALGLVLSAAGLSVVRARAADDTFTAVRGLGWSMPFATAAMLLGGLSLAGFPLTPGFVGRWALLRLLAQRDNTYVLVLFLAGVSIAVGYMRGLGALLAPPPPEPVAADAMSEAVAEAVGSAAPRVGPAAPDALAPPATVTATPAPEEALIAGEAVPAERRRRWRWPRLPVRPRLPVEPRLRLARTRLPRVPRLPRLPALRWPVAEPPLTTVMLIIGIAVCLTVAVAPQTVLPWVQRVAALYTFFGS